jgi:hypothetical protein
VYKKAARKKYASTIRQQGEKTLMAWIDYQALPKDSFVH